MGRPGLVAVAVLGVVAVFLGTPLLVMLLVVIDGPAVGRQIAEQQCGSPPPAATTGTRGGGFGIGTLNWRGASHYRRNPHPNESPYRVRMPYMIATIDASGASIIGFQEFEPAQAAAFRRRAGHRWGLVAGRAHGHPDTRDAIAYLRSQWTPTAIRYVEIAYAGPHHRIRIPLVRFASRTGDRTVWVLNTHNPADVVGGSNRLRDRAVHAEATRLRRLATAHPASGVFLTGDMNDHARFRKAFLATAGAGWQAANPNAGQIDWILGGPGVGFSHTVVEGSTNDGAHHYTDHPFIHTRATLAPPSGSARSGGGRSRATTAAPTRTAATPVDAHVEEGGLGFRLPRPRGPRLDSLDTPPAPIPRAIRADYLRAAHRYQLPWTLLAGIGMEETSHGANTATSPAGARGLMQFLPATWARYGVDGDGDGHAEITDPADSAMSAANYLTASGVAQGQPGVRRALAAYNHAAWYVNDVLFYAHAYGGGTVLGDRADCGPVSRDAAGNPHLPPVTSARVGRM
ncbi:MAG: lytic murein transglycosylase, partial [Sciscionella sp.]